MPMMVQCSSLAVLQGGGIKRTEVQRPTSYNVQLTPNYFAVGVQFRSFSTEEVMLKSNKDTTVLHFEPNKIGQAPPPPPPDKIDSDYLEESGISLRFGVAGRHCQGTGQILCFIIYSYGSK